MPPFSPNAKVKARAAITLQNELRRCPRVAFEPIVRDFSMSCGPVKRAAIAVWIHADVQDNGDGTWTAVADLGGRVIGPVTCESREDALSLVSDAASVDVSDFIF